MAKRLNDVHDYIPRPQRGERIGDTETKCMKIIVRIDILVKKLKLGDMLNVQESITVLNEAVQVHN